MSEPTNAKQAMTVVAVANLVDSIFRTDVPSCSFTDRKPLPLKKPKEPAETPRVQRDTVESSCQTAWDFPRWRPLWFSPLKHLADVTPPARENKEKLRIGDR